MGLRTWARLLLLAVGLGALVGTSQLGLAYGLGIVRLARTFDGPTQDQWPAQVTWFAWFTLVSAAAGAWLAGRLSGNDSDRTARAVHVVLAAGAVVGAAVVAPLAMQPARTAQVVDADPVFVLGVSVGLATVAGAAAGYAALTSRTAGLSMLVTTALMWALALASVAPSLAGTDMLPAARLGGLDPVALAPATTQRFALVTMPAAALVIGALLGWFARQSGRAPLTVATAGLGGPALVALAYLIAGPGTGTAHYQSVPYWAAAGAVLTGLLGSLLAAMIRRTAGPPPGPALAEAVAEHGPTGADDTTRTMPLGQDRAAGSGPGDAPGTTGRQFVGDPELRDLVRRRGPRDQHGHPPAEPRPPARPGPADPWAYPAEQPPGRPGPTDPWAHPTEQPPAHPAGDAGEARHGDEAMSALRRRPSPAPVDPPVDPVAHPSARLAPPHAERPSPFAVPRQHPEEPPAAGDGRPPRTAPMPAKENDYVDWVSGLGDR